MTVCVAAIAGGGTCVYGASDRMITSWDIEFEPQLELAGIEEGTEQKPLKVFPLTNSIAAMIAGDDIATLTLLMYELSDKLAARIKADPQNWWKVADVAYLYQQMWSQYKLRTIERKVLASFNLTPDTFISRQTELNPNLLSDLVGRIDAIKLPNLSVIFAGVDPTGAHLYVARNGEVSCEDLVGFAAIGSGNWHAESQFMALGHNRDSKLARAVYLTYASKRRAEIAPGVGVGTDMFYIGPNLGTYNPIGTHATKEFEKTYENARKRARKLWDQQVAHIQTVLDGFVAAAAAQQKSQKPDDKPAGDGNASKT